MRAFADGVGARVLAAHRECVRWTSRHDERNIRTRIGRNVRYLGHLHINRFTKSGCDRSMILGSRPKLRRRPVVTNPYER